MSNNHIIASLAVEHILKLPYTFRGDLGQNDTVLLSPHIQLKLINDQALELY